MPLPDRPRSPYRSSDQRWAEAFLHGQIPTGPRAYRHPLDRGDGFIDRWRPSPDRYVTHYNHRRSNWQGDRHTRRENDLGLADPESLFVQEHQSEEQILAEGFVLQQREMRKRAEREQELEEHRQLSQGLIAHHQNRVWARKNINDLPAPDSKSPRSTDEPEVKEEPSDDLIPVHSYGASYPPQEQCKATLPTTSTPAKETKRDSDSTNNATLPPILSGDSAPLPSTPSPLKGGKKRCTCPIGFNCEAKENGLVDCRTLVTEHKWRDWEKKFRENFEAMLADPTEESFATLAELSPIIRLLDQVSRRTRRLGLKVIYDHMLLWIRRMQHNSITEHDLNQTNVLGLLKPFLAESYRPTLAAKEMPLEIIEDLTILYRKWELGDLSVLPRRGLIRVSHTQYTADLNWQYKRSCDFFGHGHLVNGQVWFSRAAMMRDGAHAPPMCGIYGTARKGGAKSIVMGRHDEKNKDYYANIDQGNIIWYYGTALRRSNNDTEATNIEDPAHGTYRAERVTKNDLDQGPTPGTNALFESYRTGHPVRLFRSFRLADIVPGKPIVGFRYDGLYIVTEPVLVKKERQIYMFKMVRMEDGQGPLRQANAPLEPMKSTRKRRRGEDDD